MNGRDEEMESEQDHQQPAGSQPRHGFNLKSVSDSWLDDASGLNSCDLRGHGVAAPSCVLDSRHLIIEHWKEKRTEKKESFSDAHHHKRSWPPT